MEGWSKEGMGGVKGWLGHRVEAKRTKKLHALQQTLDSLHAKLNKLISLFQKHMCDFEKLKKKKKEKRFSTVRLRGAHY